MELMIIKLLGFVLVLTRVSAFFLVTPIFSAELIPNSVKILIVTLLSIFFAAVAPSPIDFEQINEIQAMMMILNESIYGFALGLICVLIFSAVKVAGQIIEREMGLSMGDVLDPLTGETAESLSILLEMLFILMFLSANGHYMLLTIISKSYNAFPAGTIASMPSLIEGVIKAGSIMLLAGLRLAAPMLAAFLLLLVVLAIFARLIPDMDILFMSMPLQVGLGLLMVGAFLPFINQFVKEFADWMGKLVPV
jgi:flagellar biosynthesis protein FliR